MGEAELLRRLFADRRNRPPWPGYSALWTDEACGAERSAYGKIAARGCATSSGKSTGRLLQPGWIPKSPEVWRTGPRNAGDPWLGKWTFPALRANPPQY